ncbi:hemerythrin domain-containing protein [Macrococcus sp. DPC7161]|uniref:hemerythrin domain-containing protein n=1 Tax=Macrococcus sp. DPC7161 TaxID=2507060 RepID=UPI00100B0B63|nr:hemerythrin domain-containing protein [Macrococcus sp. DPC7161]RXK18592.1 hemerythrin domain-containing protein [Macrococcus sp. DPC7161]
MTQQFQTKMKALRVLENEHMLLRSMMHDWFQLMRNINISTMPLVKFQQLKALRESLNEFLPVLRKHQEKEEKFFFPILGSYIGTEQGPIVTIEAEHDEMMQYFSHFMNVTDMMDLKPEEIELLLKDLNEGYEICMVHMYKEESVLFTMAEKVFKIKDEEALLEAVNTRIL